MSDSNDTIGDVIPLRKRWFAAFEFDYRAYPEANASRFGHWSASSAKRKKDRAALFVAWHRAGKPRPPGRIAVRFVRIAPRELDTDNLGNSFKAMRDELARCFGLDDGPRAPITWSYAQERGAPRRYAVRVEVEGWA